MSSDETREWSLPGALPDIRFRWSWTLQALGLVHGARGAPRSRCGGRPFAGLGLDQDLVPCSTRFDDVISPFWRHVGLPMQPFKNTQNRPGCRMETSVTLLVLSLRVVQQFAPSAHPASTPQAEVQIGDIQAGVVFFFPFFA